MNSIFLFQTEVASTGEICLTGERLIGVIKRNPWLSDIQERNIKAAVQGIGRGTIQISEVSQSRL